MNGGGCVYSHWYDMHGMIPREVYTINIHECGVVAPYRCPLHRGRCSSGPTRHPSTAVDMHAIYNIWDVSIGIHNVIINAQVNDTIGCTVMCSYVA